MFRVRREQPTGSPRRMLLDAAPAGPRIERYFLLGHRLRAIQGNPHDFDLDP